MSTKSSDLMHLARKFTNNSVIEMYSFLMKMFNIENNDNFKF